MRSVAFAPFECVSLWACHLALVAGSPFAERHPREGEDLERR